MDATKDPQLNLGKQFVSPKKRWTSRAKRVQKRNVLLCQHNYRYILLIHGCVQCEYSDRSCSALMHRFTVILVLDVLMKACTLFIMVSLKWSIQLCIEQYIQYKRLYFVQKSMGLPVTGCTPDAVCTGIKLQSTF